MKYLAALLELLMLCAFIGERSIPGVLLWLAYFWFSATCAIAFSRLDQ